MSWINGEGDEMLDLVNRPVTARGSIRGNNKFRLPTRTPASERRLYLVIGVFSRTTQKSSKVENSNLATT